MFGGKIDGTILVIFGVIILGLMDIFGGKPPIIFTIDPSSLKTQIYDIGIIFMATGGFLFLVGLQVDGFDF